MKCQLCAHYHYQVGIALSLQTKTGMADRPTRPTCTCDYAKISWERSGAEVRKPRGIPCDYHPREMTCAWCGRRVCGRAVSMVVNRDECMCKECNENVARDYAAKEVKKREKQNLPRHKE